MIKKDYILKFVASPDIIGVKGEVPLMFVTDYVKGDSFPIKVRYFRPIIISGQEIIVDAYSTHAWESGLIKIFSKGELVPCYLSHTHSFCNE